ncbi:DUF4097 family beta strand repeat-containing protein [Bacillus sp. 2205SS5-2]|uniref:DUF4097 family beta strand repeat-containing protein n=1 Tax=Bacillus sp. 2205SS5-2 TaxID=3109031 RepID=UPI0030070D84
MIKKMALTGVILLLIGITGGAVLFFSTGGFKVGRTTVSINESFSIGDVEELSVRSTTIDIQYKMNEKNEIVVSLEGDATENVEVEIKDKKYGQSLEIEIVEKQKSLVSFFRSANVQATVYIPEDGIKKLMLQSTTGNLVIEDFDGESFRYHTTTGNVRMNQFNGKVVEGKTTTGNMTGKELDANLELTSTTGDIEIQGKLKEDIELKTTTGNILIDVETVPKEYAISFDTSTGDFIVDWPELQVKNDGDYSHTTGNGPKVKVKTTTGDVNLISSPD